MVYLDLDNWQGFFQRLPVELSRSNFVHGFYGGATQWKDPTHVPAFQSLVKSECWKLHTRCLNRKDAADFAIVFQCGNYNQMYPPWVLFSVVSGDRGLSRCSSRARLTVGVGWG